MKKRFVDLTFPISENMMTYPVWWHTKVMIRKLGDLTSEGRETRKLILGTHSGTHIDAPLHFIKGGKTIDSISLKILTGKAMVISFIKRKYKGEITVVHLKEKIGRRKVPERLILRFDWSGKWEKSSYYKDYPHLSRDACRWLIEKGIKLIGMDTPSPDSSEHKRYSDIDSPNHRLLLKNNVVLVEYLCNLRQLKSKNIFLVALPLKIKSGDASPARVIARDL